MRFSDWYSLPRNLRFHSPTHGHRLTEPTFLRPALVGRKQPLAEVLVSSEKLGTEVKTLTGTLRKVDADKGEWRLKSHTDGEEYSGKIGAGVSLSRVIIDSEYTFICEETTEFAIASGKETQNLTLTSLRENR